MDCKEFYFKGKEDLDIHVYKWTSKIVNPKAVVQIAHGMSETAIRYEEFAKKLTENGYIVYINDHRGHGLTAKTIDNVGYLADKDGFRCLVEDMNTLTNIIKEENPDAEILFVGTEKGKLYSVSYDLITVKCIWEGEPIFSKPLVFNQWIVVGCRGDKLLVFQL